MILRNVERGEVVEVCFDLAAVFDDVTERHEDIFDSLAQDRDRVAMAVRRTPAGQRHVDAFARRAFGFDVLLEILLGLLDGLHYRRFARLDQLAEGRTPIRSNSPD